MEMVAVSVVVLIWTVEKEHENPCKHKAVTSIWITIGNKNKKTRTSSNTEQKNHYSLAHKNKKWQTPKNTAQQTYHTHTHTPTAKGITHTNTRTAKRITQTLTQQNASHTQALTEHTHTQQNASHRNTHSSLWPAAACPWEPRAAPSTAAAEPCGWGSAGRRNCRTWSPSLIASWSPAPRSPPAAHPTPRRNTAWKCECEDDRWW